MASAPDFADVAEAVATALELPVGAVTPDALVVDTCDDSLALYCVFVALDAWLAGFELPAQLPLEVTTWRDVHHYLTATIAHGG